MKRKILIVLIGVSILQILFFIIYLTFMKSDVDDIISKGTVEQTLKSEGKSALGVVSKNAWYITMVLRKIEVTSRMFEDLVESTLTSPNIFPEYRDLKQYIIDTKYHFYWGPKTRGNYSVIFESSLSSGIDKPNRKPSILSYLDVTLRRAYKNNLGIDSIYIMTDSACRIYPWVDVEDLIKTDLFTISNIKVKPDTLFSKEEKSPYSIANANREKNKGIDEIWTEPFWSEYAKSWVISYYNFLYVRNVYKGVLGVDISVNKLVKDMINKNFGYNNVFPIIVDKNGKLLASSVNGYEILKINTEKHEPASVNLLSSKESSLKRVVTNMIDVKFFNPLTPDSELGGIEKVIINNKENYLVYYPIRTANLAFGLVIPSVELKKISIGRELSPVASIFKNRVLTGAIILVFIAVISVFVISNLIKPLPKSFSVDDSLVMEKAQELAIAKFEQEKKNISIKTLELETAKSDLQRELTETRNRLQKEKDGYLSRTRDLEKNLQVITDESKRLKERIRALESKQLSQPDASVRAKFEEDKKNLLLKTDEIQNINLELKNNLNKLKQENKQLMNKVNALEEEGKSVTIKLISKFEEEKKTLNIELNKLQEQLNNSNMRNTELEKIIQRAKEFEIDMSRWISVDEAHNDVTAERKKYLSLIEQLEQEKNNLTNENKRLAERVKLSEQGTGADNLSKLKEENESLKNKIKALEEEGKNVTYKLISKFEDEKKMLNAEILQIKKEMEELLNSNKELEEKLKVTEANIDRNKWIPVEEISKSINEESKAYLTKIEEFERENAKLIEENNKFAEHLKFIEDKKAEVDKQTQQILIKFEEEKKELNLKIETLNEKLNTAESKIRGLETERDDILSKLKESDDKLTVLKEERKVEEVREKESEEEIKEKIENNILVVDDHGEIIKIFGDTIYNLGYNIYIARNSTMALQKLALGNYKYVFLNTKITDRNFKEVYESIEKADAELAKQVVFYVTDNIEIEFLKDKVLLKPSYTEADIKNILKEE